MKGHCTCIYLEGQRKTKRNPNQDTLSSSREPNPGPPKREKHVLTTCSHRSLQNFISTARVMQSRCSHETAESQNSQNAKNSSRI